MGNRRVPVALAFSVIALLRIATLAREPWEWDEVLYTEAVDHGLDVRVNHPHAPGYPAFILAGRLLHATGASPFEAATLAAALGGLLASVAAFALLEVVGLSQSAALGGAVLYAAAPSVWIHSVRPLSDAPAAAAFLFATALLVKARASLRARHLLSGAGVAALAFGVRPQVGLALLPVAAWAAFAFMRKLELRVTLLAACLGTALSVGLYVPVVAGSGGWRTWRSALVGQMRFTRGESPSLREFLSSGFWKRWWFDPWNGGDIAFPVLALAFIAFALAPRRAGTLTLLFAPLSVLTMCLLYPGHAPRYALPMLALPCGLAAVALDEALHRGVRLRWAAAILFTGLVAGCAVVAVPAVVELREATPPSVAVFRRVLNDPTLSDRRVLVNGALEVHAAYLLPSGRWRVAEDRAPLRPERDEIVAWADEAPAGLRPIVEFHLLNPNLRRLTRARYVSAGLYVLR